LCVNTKDHDIVLFKCNWWDEFSKGGYWIDKYEFFLINSNGKLMTRDPNWLIVVKTKSGDFVLEKATLEACQEND